MAILGQFRGDLLSNWESVNPVIHEREFILIKETVNGPWTAYKIGDGVKRFKELPYASNVSILQELGNSETAVVSQATITVKMNELKEIFLPDRSFSGLLNIDYSHIASLNSDGTFNSYSESDLYDCGWCLILRNSKTLSLEGANASRVLYFNSLNPSSDSYIATNGLFGVIPSNAKLALINFPKASNNEGYLSAIIKQEGMGSSVYEVQNSKDVILGNFFSKKAVALRGSTGETTTSVSGVNTTDFLPIDRLSNIKVNGYRLVSNDITPIAFYDENFQFISAYNGDVHSNGIYEYLLEDIPSNARYIRCTENTASRSTTGRIEGVNLSSIITSEIYNKNKLYGSVFNIIGHAVRSNGNVTSAASQDIAATGFLPLDKKQNFAMYGRVIKSSSLVPYAFYDENFQFISAYNGDVVGPASAFFFVSSSDLPSNAKFVRCTAALSDGIIYSGISLYSSIDFSNELLKFLDIKTLPKGKNYLNPIDNIIGYGITVSSSGNASITINPDGILSNKLFLEEGFYSLSGVRPNPASNYAYLLHLNSLGSVIGTQRFEVNVPENNYSLSLYVNIPDGYAYSLLSLKNVASGVYDPTKAQFEKGGQVTKFESWKGNKYFVGNVNTYKEGYRPNMMLFGNSTAFPGNAWFQIGCSMLGVKGYNKAVSGELIYQFANNYKNRNLDKPYGSVFTKQEFNDFEVLVLSHSNTVPVHLEDNLRETVADYADYTFVSDTDYSMAWDYVLKQYRKDCYDARLDPESKWYGTQEGKPCYIIVCTWPVDSRTTYNKSIRILQKKWGFALMNFDENALFYSKVPMEELITPTNPDTGVTFPPSYMTPVLHSAFYTNPSEGQNNVVNMWHQSRKPDSPIQKRMGLQFYSFVLNGLRTVYTKPDSQDLTGQYYINKDKAIRLSDGQEVSATKYYTTDFIPLNKSQDLILDGYVPTNGVYTPCAFYDKDKNFIGGIKNEFTGETWNTSSNSWLSDFVVKKERFNSGGEFENAFYFRCTDLNRRGEIKNMSMQFLLDKIIKLCAASGINFENL